MGTHLAPQQLGYGVGRGAKASVQVYKFQKLQATFEALILDACDRLCACDLHELQLPDAVGKQVYIDCW